MPTFTNTPEVPPGTPSTPSTAPAMNATGSTNSQFFLSSLSESSSPDLASLRSTLCCWVLRLESRGSVSISLLSVMPSRHAVEEASTTVRSADITLSTAALLTGGEELRASSSVSYRPVAVRRQGGWRIGRGKRISKSSDGRSASAPAESLQKVRRLFFSVANTSWSTSWCPRRVSLSSVQSRGQRKLHEGEARITARLGARPGPSVVHLQQDMDMCN